MEPNKQVGGLLQAILTSATSENDVGQDELAAIPAVQKAREAIHKGKFDEFDAFFAYPISRMLDGFLARELPQSEQAQFLFKHNEFVEQHFEKIIVKFEGSACCADKTRTILSSLLEFFKTRKEIAFNYNQEYTYHLPTKVFTTHAEIVTYFDAVYRLYYGSHEPFMVALKGIYDRMVVLSDARIHPPVF